ncbi:MAG: hypothetical protein IJ899_00995 [Blautia sp.]|nr:hypothetical protein [Blautia sp.]
MTWKSRPPGRRTFPGGHGIYQGIIDLNIIRRGEDYDKLKKSFIIFICTYDPFGKGRYIYTFDQTAREDRSVLLDDEAVKIVLNTKETTGDISDDLKEALRYMDGHACNGVYERTGQCRRGS